MVFEALTPLLLILAKIDNLLANPDKSLYPDYFERQKSRFDKICEDTKTRIQVIINENLPNRRKCTKLNALRDELWKNLYESKFLDALKAGIITYDINDYHSDHPDIKKTEDEIRELLAIEELVDKNMLPDKEKAGQYIFNYRKTLSSEDISSFFVYLYAIPIISIEIEKLSVEQKTDNNYNNTQAVPHPTLSSSRQIILDQLLVLADKGEWTKGVTADDVKAMLKFVLDQGEKQLTGNESEQSATLWQLLENGRGERVKIVWQNMVGYFADKHLLPSQMGAPALNKMFFGDETGYSNIDKGRPSKGLMTADFESVVPLLDVYVPKV